MLFKNKSLLVTPVNTPQNEEPPHPSIPFKDPLFDLRMLIEESIPKVFVGLIAYKTATTVLRAAEHVVVTKVK